MFSGIVHEVGKLLDKNVKDKATFVISKPKNFEIELGDSVSCNGVCLTVAEISDKSFSVDIMAETLAKTNLGKIEKNDPVNLEPASRLGDKLDGHIVQGHVDCVGTIEEINHDNNGTTINVKIPKEFENLIVEKGSICIEGISLTAFNVNDNGISVSLVDYTLKNTNAASWSAGKKVNIEFDIIGKYVAKMLKDRR